MRSYGLKIIDLDFIFSWQHHLLGGAAFLFDLYFKAPFTPESYAGVTLETSEHFRSERANPTQILPLSRSS